MFLSRVTIYLLLPARKGAGLLRRTMFNSLKMAFLLTIIFSLTAYLASIISEPVAILLFGACVAAAAATARKRLRLRQIHATEI